MARRPIETSEPDTEQPAWLQFVPSSLKSYKIIYSLTAMKIDYFHLSVASRRAMTTNRHWG